MSIADTQALQSLAAPTVSILNQGFIQSVDLFNQLDAETCAELAEICIEVTLEPGQLLIRNGAEDSDMYLLESGELEVFLLDDQSAERVVNTVLPGQTVGESAVLTGARRSASVRVVCPSTAHRITRDAFDQLAARLPGLRNSVETAVRTRLQAANLASALFENQVLGALDAPILHDLQREIQLVTLKKGDRLMAQGEQSDSLYIVVHGRLRVFEETASPEPSETSNDTDGKHVSLKPLVDLGRGQTVGEMGLLCGEPRNASVYALRDSLVGKLDTDTYYRLLQKYPKPLTELFSSRILGRLAKPQKKKNRTFAVIGLQAAGASTVLPVDTLSKRLRWHIENPWEKKKTTGEKISVGFIDEQVVDSALGEPGIFDAAAGTSAELRLAGWIGEQEERHEYLFYATTYNNHKAGGTQWLSRISALADHLIFVAFADDNIDDIELPLRADTGTGEPQLNPGCSLVLLHPQDRTEPSGTSQWLAKLAVDSHHHVRWSDTDDVSWKDTVNSDIARVSRLITQRGIGLVLSGGAARGFAHIGVIRAMHEAGVPIDLFGGASAGAISASIIVAGHDDEKARELVITHGKRSNMNDYTLPSTSLFKGKRFSSLLRSFVGDVKIEDLWQSFYCISISLADATEVIHRRGTLWKYVRASASMPILLPPVADKGRLLADGAMLNAMPVEIMRSDPGCGIVIGVDVSGGTGMHGEFEYGTELSGWRQLISRFNPFGKPHRSPSLSATILAISAIGAVGRVPKQREHADLYIRPPVHKYRMMDYDSREPIMEDGYQTAKSEIAKWLAR